MSGSRYWNWAIPAILHLRVRHVDICLSAATAANIARRVQGQTKTCIYYDDIDSKTEESQSGGDSGLVDVCDVEDRVKNLLGRFGSSRDATNLLGECLCWKT